MSESNQLSRPLGANVPLPGGDIVDTPEQRATVPGGTPGGGASASMSFNDARTNVFDQHSRNKALYELTSKALRQIDTVRKSLDRLAEKRDVVTMEDIIHEAGKLVGHGIDPAALAGILADAPQEGGGEALGAWIAGHADNMMKQEAALMQEHKLIQHNMGISAIHAMMAHANGTSLMQGMPNPMSGAGPENPFDMEPR